MKPKKQKINDLMDDFFDYMRSINRTEHSLRRYRQKWKLLLEFMAANQIKYYNKKVELAFLRNELGKYDYYQLDREKRDLVNITEALEEFQRTNLFFMGPRKHHPREFHGSAANSIKAVSYTHLRAHETDSYLVCRLLLEKTNK